jgi:hypothetical protein
MEMKRYDYVRSTKLGRYGESVVQFMVFDRVQGCTEALALCEDRFNAEKIAAALNQAKDQ